MNIEEAINVVDEHVRKQWSIMSYDLEAIGALCTILDFVKSKQWQPIETATKDEK